MTNILGVLSRVITFGAVIFFIYVIYKLYDKVCFIEKKLKDDGQLNNHCDVCCKDCDDKFECTGACIHAVKPEDCYKMPERSADNG